jgi:hypothetical protein
MLASKNPWDWLGYGIYFWENNYERALQWAYEHFDEPAVIGAVIELGYCLNLTDSKKIEDVKKAYKMLQKRYIGKESEMPRNKNVVNNRDFLIRDLDCAVIQQLHEYRSEAELPPYETVRGVFVEGKEIYLNSGFKDKTHIQICVVKPDCIKGLFKPK